MRAGGIKEASWVSSKNARDNNQHINLLVRSTCLMPRSESAPESLYPWVLPEDSVTLGIFILVDKYSYFVIVRSGSFTFHNLASSM